MAAGRTLATDVRSRMNLSTGLEHEDTLYEL